MASAMLLLRAAAASASPSAKSLLISTSRRNLGPSLGAGYGSALLPPPPPPPSPSPSSRPPSSRSLSSSSSSSSPRGGAAPPGGAGATSTTTSPPPPSSYDPPRRLKSTAPSADADDEEDEDDASPPSASSPTPTLPRDDDDDRASASPPSLASAARRNLDRGHMDEIHLDNNTPTSVPDYTSDKTKSGTPSPWAVFDAWGAGDAIVDPLSEEEGEKLSPRSVAIPFSEGEKAELPDETEILRAYDHLLKRKSSVHFGYPYNLMYNHEELYEFMKYSINNLGDPFVTSNYGVHSRQFECSVIDFFARLWKMEEGSYWGYVTTCGTEGNLHGILLARECHPDGILYTSKETHYSIFKAARYYRMDAKAIPTLPMGEIDYDILASEIERNIDKPVIVNVNIGTTVKGAVDNLDRILRILKRLGVPRERYHVHCDGALFAMMMPFVDFAPEVSFRKPIDSIAVSGHKMLGCPMPCGVALARKEHVKKVERRIDYLNSVDTTIMGSRNGQAALYLWYSLRKKGIGGIKRDVMHCIETAGYLRNKIAEAGFTCRLNDLSCTVVLERPTDDRLVKRWQLACEEDIAHVVVMPNVTRQKIDKFVEELAECAAEHGRQKPLRPDSPLTKLTSNAWGGDVVAPVGNFKGTDI